MNDIPSTPAAKVLQERMEQSRQVALHEVRELRKALADLEQFLTGKRKRPGPDLFDVVHSAFEIFRNSSALADYGKLLEDLGSEVDRSQALALLEAKGARLLTKPAGWHWINPKGEMHFLAKKDEPEKALDALGKLQTGGGRQRKAKGASAGASQPAEAVQATKAASGSEQG
ncbi:hypothetical protein PCS_00840 [Desulfocurvibacter africanus PCS]|uniref:Uncharacterized protein n=1 Tax=Desulfocurvibacter africanus PCS TaxID=1262666 RepID=M5Q3F1_DESAF|nr:hypothetical protein [Desulfocurvibacter africanus]EMG38338.1 hypothetical protein PCS_00840 [Desulfocurvibacter africanus PCS]